MRQRVAAFRQRIGDALRKPFDAVGRLDPFERLFYGGLLLLAAGLAMWNALPLALIVPGIAISGSAFYLKVRKP